MAASAEAGQPIGGSQPQCRLCTQGKLEGATVQQPGMRVLAELFHQKRPKLKSNAAQASEPVQNGTDEASQSGSANSKSSTDSSRPNNSAAAGGAAAPVHGQQQQQQEQQQEDETRSKHDRNTTAAMSTDQAVSDCWRETPTLLQVALLFAWQSLLSAPGSTRPAAQAEGTQSALAAADNRVTSSPGSPGRHSSSNITDATVARRGYKPSSPTCKGRYDCPSTSLTAAVHDSAGQSSQGWPQLASHVAVLLLEALVLLTKHSSVVHVLSTKETAYQLATLLQTATYHGVLRAAEAGRTVRLLSPALLDATLQLLIHLLLGGHEQFLQGLRDGEAVSCCCTLLQQEHMRTGTRTDIVKLISWLGNTPAAAQQDMSCLLSAGQLQTAGAQQGLQQQQQQQQMQQLQRLEQQPASAQSSTQTHAAGWAPLLPGKHDVAADTEQLPAAEQPASEGGHPLPPALQGHAVGQSAGSGTADEAGLHPVMQQVQHAGTGSRLTWSLARQDIPRCVPAVAELFSRTAATSTVRDRTAMSNKVRAAALSDQHHSSVVAAAFAQLDGLISKPRRIGSNIQLLEESALGTGLDSISSSIRAAGWPMQSNKPAHAACDRQAAAVKAAAGAATSPFRRQAAASDNSLVSLLTDAGSPKHMRIGRSSPIRQYKSSSRKDSWLFSDSLNTEISGHSRPQSQNSPGAVASTSIAKGLTAAAMSAAADAQAHANRLEWLLERSHRACTRIMSPVRASQGMHRSADSPRVFGAVSHASLASNKGPCRQLEGATGSPQGAISSPSPMQSQSPARKDTQVVRGAACVAGGGCQLGISSTSACQLPVHIASRSSSAYLAPGVRSYWQLRTPPVQAKPFRIPSLQSLTPMHVPKLHMHVRPGSASSSRRYEASSTLLSKSRSQLKLAGPSIIASSAATTWVPSVIQQWPANPPKGRYSQAGAAADI